MSRVRDSHLQQYVKERNQLRYDLDENQYKRDRNNCLHALGSARLVLDVGDRHRYTRRD